MKANESLHSLFVLWLNVAISISFVAFVLGVVIVKETNIRRKAT
jgi:hypothetical protein